VTQGDAGKRTIDPEVEAALDRLTALDRELYAAARARFHGERVQLVA